MFGFSVLQLITKCYDVKLIKLSSKDDAVNKRQSRFDVIVETENWVRSPNRCKFLIMRTTQFWIKVLRREFTRLLPLNINLGWRWRGLKTDKVEYVPSRRSKLKNHRVKYMKMIYVSTKTTTQCLWSTRTTVQRTPVINSSMCVITLKNIIIYAYGLFFVATHVTNFPMKSKGRMMLLFVDKRY